MRIRRRPLAGNRHQRLPAPLTDCKIVIRPGARQRQLYRDRPRRATFAQHAKYFYLQTVPSPLPRAPRAKPFRVRVRRQSTDPPTRTSSRNDRAGDLPHLGKFHPATAAPATAMPESVQIHPHHPQRPHPANRRPAAPCGLTSIVRSPPLQPQRRKRLVLLHPRTSDFPPPKKPSTFDQIEFVISGHGLIPYHVQSKLARVGRDSVLVPPWRDPRRVLAGTMAKLCYYIALKCAPFADAGKPIFEKRLQGCTSGRRRLFTSGFMAGEGTSE